MSTGNLRLDIALNNIIESTKNDNRISTCTELKSLFPNMNEKEISDLSLMMSSLINERHSKDVSLVATTPPSFSIKAKSTKNTVSDILSNAEKSILITGYSLSEYFSDLVDLIIDKSQRGVFVKFYVNHIESQDTFDKLLRYKGRFLKIYNYPKSEDRMAALHAKVISVDQRYTLITSANLSYHGQQGNIELGSLIESNDIAKQVDDLFEKLLFKKIFVEIK